jgi:hypothetical protein
MSSEASMGVGWMSELVLLLSFSSPACPWFISSTGEESFLLLLVVSSALCANSCWFVNPKIVEDFHNDKLAQGLWVFSETEQSCLKTLVPCIVLKAICIGEMGVVYVVKLGVWSLCFRLLADWKWRWLQHLLYGHYAFPHCSVHSRNLLN